MSNHAENETHTDDAPTCDVHVMPVKVLVGVFVALVGLTILTVEAAKFDVGSFDVIVSMAIATVKASLVVFIFMHLWYDKPVNRIAFLFSIIFAGFFLCMILLDSHAYDRYVKGFADDKAAATAVAPAATPAPGAKPAADTGAKPADTDAKPAADAGAKPAPTKK